MIFCLLILPLGFLTLAVGTNLYREHRRYRLLLKPNCLLTRAPLVFLTGPRSVFYFRKYWNAYPEILAEHGYEVFTLHLPWRDSSARRFRLEEFLKAHQGLRYHFICDSWTHQEMKAKLEASPVCASLSELPASSPVRSGWCLRISYFLHHRWLGTGVPSSEQLGLLFPNAASWLLKRAQELGEQDFAGI